MSRRLIPTAVLRHTGQRRAQLAIWTSGKRVTRAQWRMALVCRLVVQFVILESGQVVVTCMTDGWYDPSHPASWRGAPDRMAATGRRT